MGATQSGTAGSSVAGGRICAATGEPTGGGESGTATGLAKGDGVGDGLAGMDGLGLGLGLPSADGCGSDAANDGSLGAACATGWFVEQPAARTRLASKPITAAFMPVERDGRESRNGELAASAQLPFNRRGDLVARQVVQAVVARAHALGQVGAGVDRVGLVHRRDPREAVSYTHLRAHETRHDLVCRLL